MDILAINVVRIRAFTRKAIRHLSAYTCCFFCASFALETIPSACSNVNQISLRLLHCLNTLMSA